MTEIKSKKLVDNIILEKEILINRFKDMYARVLDANEEVKMINILNELASVFSTEPDIANIVGYDCVVDGLVEMIEYANGNDYSFSIMKSLYDKLTDKFYIFLCDLEIKNSVRIVFADTDLKERYSSVFKSKFLESKGECIVLIHRMNVQDEVKETMPCLGIDIESLIDAIVDATYKSPNYQKILCRNKFDYMEKNNPCSLLSSGSSYSLYGFLPEESAYQAVDISVAGQDLYYTYKSISRALKSNSTIEKCLVSVGYYSFNYDISRSENTGNEGQVLDLYSYLYNDTHNCLKPTREKGIGANMGPIPYEISGLFDNEGLSQFIMNRVYTNYLNDNYFNFFNKEITRESHLRELNNVLYAEQSYDEKVEGVRAAVKGHNKCINYEETYLEYVCIMEKMLMLFEEKGIEPVFVVYPTPVLYREFIDPKLKNVFYKTMNKYRDSFRFHIYDLFDDEDFTDEDFVDPYHLNTKGALKATRKIDIFLKSLS